MSYNLSIGTMGAENTGYASFIGLLFAIASIVATVMIYRKAGREGWEAIIPFYNTYTEYKLFWTTKMFWISFALKAVSVMCGAFILGLVLLMGMTSSEISAMFVAIAAVVVGIACQIANMVISIIKTQKMAHAFQKKGMFTVGLFFFNSIFRMILAFGRYEYAGANL